MRITFLGCGDAFGSGGRFQTCIVVETRDSCVLLDCGASSLVAMQRHGFAPARVDGVLLTHYHGDHFGGLPFLVLEAQFGAFGTQSGSKRTRDLTIAGPVGVEARMTEVMEALFRGSSTVVRPFALRYIDLPASQATRVGELLVTAEPVRHGEGASAHGLRLECDGQVVAYSGDTAWTDALPRLAAGADLFICEASFYDRKTSGHLDYETLAAKRADLDCRRVILTHLGSDVLARRAALAFECAEDGLTIDV